METRRPCRTGRSQAGFTLIEILVVLVIAGLIAGVALPRLFAISQRYERASQRDSLLTEIGNLGYVAYTTGKPIALGGTDPSQPAPVTIPAGWRIEVPQAVVYGFNGVCSGGTVTLVAPDGAREELKLQAPACRTGASGAAS